MDCQSRESDRDRNYVNVYNSAYFKLWLVYCIQVVYRLNNSYPNKFIYRVKTRIRKQAPLERNWASTVCIPYLPKTFEAIRRTLGQEGNRVALTPTKTLGKSLTHAKVSIPKYSAGQLVYKLSCQDCKTVYMGENSRSVADRMKKHSRLIKRHPKNNEERTKLDRN